ncbi:MAG TPA: MBL fold metallo-hydrolase [Chloroflexia bacterium]|jgi:hypothetical protein
MVRYAKASFVAIAVGQGDAFYLERGKHSVLVDAGKARRGIADRFRVATGRNSVDIIACTHNDADHAEGIMGVLESGISCKEVWLPAIWSNRLEDLLLNPVEVGYEIALDIGEMSGQELSAVIQERGASLTALGDHLADRFREKLTRSVEDEQGRDEDPGFYDTRAMSNLLEEGSQTQTQPIETWSRVISMNYHLDPWWYLSRVPNLTSDQAFTIFWEAISAGERIRSIAIQAYQNGCAIRWFQFDNDSDGIQEGQPGFLVPMNAREVFRFPIRKSRSSLRLLEALALSVSNRESLVFLAPGTWATPEVLFCGDSDLRFRRRIPWSKGMIVTAPHHGSDSNSGAYQRFSRDTADACEAVWIRSDGRYRSRPGALFMHRPPDSRICTLCRGSANPSQNIKLLVDRSKRSWQPLTTVRRCECRELES